MILEMRQYFFLLINMQFLIKKDVNFIKKKIIRHEVFGF